MAWELNSGKPIYTQLVEKVRLDIISGNYKPGEKIPSVRDLAAEAAVNPNTMQKALSELERTGLIFSNRTSGRYITEDEKMIETAKKQTAAAYAKEFLKNMEHLGLTQEEIKILLTDVSGKEDEICQ